MERWNKIGLAIFGCQASSQRLFSFVCVRIIDQPP
jgi:hypothetical protein